MTPKLIDHVRHLPGGFQGTSAWAEKGGAWDHITNRGGAHRNPDCTTNDSTLTHYI